ncbi:MAG: hypothetical protein AAF850_10815, partial [Pseudomonadota bacterium]
MLKPGSDIPAQKNDLAKFYSDAPPRYLFIIGLHRSGTTLLSRIIASQEWCSGFENTDAPMDEGQYLQSVFTFVDRVGRIVFFRDARHTEKS